MITLNILPPAKKRDLRFNQLYAMIKNLIILVLLLSILTSITLLFTKMTLENYFIRIVQETTLTTQYAQIFNEDIKELNESLKAVEEIQNNYIYWTKFFVIISSMIPQNVSILSIDINQDRILITGLAQTRDQLLKLKKNLENNNLFSKVVIPLDNLLKRVDINFDIKAKLDLEQLKTYGD